MKTSQPEEKDSCVSDEVTSWVSVCPRGLWEVHRKRTRWAEPVDMSGDVFPGIGSLCRIRVQHQGDPDTALEQSLNPDQPVTAPNEAQVQPLQRSQGSVLQVPLGDWIVLRLGEGHCDIIEGCIEGMRAGERCEVQLNPLTDPHIACPGEGEDQSMSVIVDLQTFSPGFESWQLTAGEKWNWVMSLKKRGGERFRDGDVWGAADCYSRAIRLLISLKLHPWREAHGLAKIEEEDEEEENKEKCPSAPTERQYCCTKASLHSNLSLCQMKLGQYSRARTSAARATLLEPQGEKAWYRLGQANLEAGELGEAARAFRRLLELQPDSPSALKGLREVGRRERETDSQLGQRLSKMFSSRNWGRERGLEGSENDRYK
ncbi:FK506-binding protein-like [Esox lucius]|uniref:FK506-binding protein-like n=1 Tax=Esox lucius TaxID=8010 RepID=A0AAY5KQF3_ESOLU|nr:FK506-binding protein-like [Esox lucius]